MLAGKVTASKVDGKFQRSLFMCSEKAVSKFQKSAVMPSYVSLLTCDRYIYNLSIAIEMHYM